MLYILRVENDSKRSNGLFFIKTALTDIAFEHNFCSFVFCYSFHSVFIFWEHRSLVESVISFVFYFFDFSYKFFFFLLLLFCYPIRLFICICGIRSNQSSFKCFLWNRNALEMSLYFAVKHTQTHTDCWLLQFVFLRLRQLIALSQSKNSIVLQWIRNGYCVFILRCCFVKWVKDLWRFSKANVYVKCEYSKYFR